MLIKLINRVCLAEPGNISQGNFPEHFSSFLLCQIIFSLVNFLCPFQYEKGLISVLMFSVVAASKIQVRKGGHSENCLELEGRGIKSGSLLGL